MCPLILFFFFFLVTAEEVSNENTSSLSMDSLEMYGLVLIVGWFPDMKVDAIPLISSSHQLKAQTIGVDKFIDDIKKYSMEVANSSSPAAIVMFGDKCAANHTRLLARMDEAFTRDTAIVGHFTKCFDFMSRNASRQVHLSSRHCLDGVAFIFARDINKGPEIGNTQFHVPCMRSVSKIGSTFTVASINTIDQEKCRTYLSARKTTDGKLLTDIRALCLLEGMDERIYFDDCYIGIERNMATQIINKDEASSSAALPRPSKSISLRSLELDKWDNSMSLVVNGDDVNVGDSFEFYMADFKRSLLMDGIIQPMGVKTHTNVFGGLIFANMCDIVQAMTRDALAFSTPFIDHFEDATLGGLFTKNVVKRGSISSSWKNGEEEQVCDCVTSHKGIAFLVMSFTPPPPPPPSPSPLPSSIVIEE
ncbi:hypothetical protein RDABS01_010924 [Bienertia sinuspersici]